MLGWRQLLLCAAALPLTTNGALAQTSREAALEARVAELERLVSQMRGELGQARQDIARDQAALRAADTRMAAAEKRWGTSGITASTPADGFYSAATRSPPRSSSGLR